MKVLIVYYSTYGHVHQMAQAIAEGVKQVDGAEATMRRVPETLSEDILEKMGAVEAQQAISRVPVCTVEELAEAIGNVTVISILAAEEDAHERKGFVDRKSVV